MVVDRTDENFTQMDTSLADTDGITWTLYQLVAGVASIPEYKLYGTAMKGLNSTGEGETKNYLQMLRGMQENVFEPFLRKAYSIICRSDLGNREKYDIVFNPLSVPTEAEQAATQGAKSSYYGNLINAGVVSPEEVRQALRQDENSGFTDIAEDLPEDTGGMGGMPGNENGGQPPNGNSDVNTPEAKNATQKNNAADGWITIGAKEPDEEAGQNGHKGKHIYINEETGAIEKGGPKEWKGKTQREVFYKGESGNSSESSGTSGGANPPTPPVKPTAGTGGTATPPTPPAAPISGRDAILKARTPAMSKAIADYAAKCKISDPTLIEQKQFVDMRAASIGAELQTYKATTDNQLARFSDEKSRGEMKKLTESTKVYLAISSQVREIDREIGKKQKEANKLPSGSIEQKKAAEELRSLSKELKALKEKRLAAYRKTMLGRRRVSIMRCRELGEFLRDGKPTGFKTNIGQTEAGMRVCRLAINYIYGDNISPDILPTGTEKVKICNAISKNGRPPRGWYNPRFNTIFSHNDVRLTRHDCPTPNDSANTFYYMRTHGHEYAHYIEMKNPAVLANSLSFLKHRVAPSEKTVKYGKDTFCFKDHFLSKYSGRAYASRPSKFTPDKIEQLAASEVLSQGLTYMVQYGLKGFAAKDPEYFNFVIATLRGDLWK